MSALDESAVEATQSINLPAAGFLLVVLLFFLLLYLPNRSRYAAYIQPLNKKDFALRDFMPVGFAFLEKIHYGYNGRFDRNLRKKLLEMHEEEYNEFYLRVYLAYAVTCACLGLLLTGLFWMAMEGAVVWLAGGLLVSGMLAYGVLTDIDKKINELHLKVAMDLPDYVSKIIILTGAGQTLRAAMKTLSEDMGQPTPLYQIMEQAVNNIDNGMNEGAALDRVVYRCNMPEMRRLISVIQQNLQRGGADVTMAMQSIGEELWNNRKAKAKQLSEEAETKMLFPMMLMMFSVIIITAVPALLGMGI